MCMLSNGRTLDCGSSASGFNSQHTPHGASPPLSVTYGESQFYTGSHAFGKLCGGGIDIVGFFKLPTMVKLNIRGNPKTAIVDAYGI